MFERIENNLKDRVNEVVFIELKKDLELNNCEYRLDKNIPLPLPIDAVVNKVKGLEEINDISIAKIIKGMILIIGIDSGFRHNDTYIDFLTSFDQNIDNYILGQGIELARKDRKMDALIYFKASLYINKENLNSLYNYARCCEEIAKSDEKEIIKEFEDEAFEVFEILTEKHPDFPLSYYHLGFHYANKKQFKKAEITWKTCLEKGIDENKEMEIQQKLLDISNNIQYEEGYTLVLRGEAKEGLEKLLPLEEKYSDWWNLLFFIGLAYRQMQDYEKALKYYEKVLKYKPSQVDALNEIGLCYMSLGQINEAIKHFKRGLNINKNDSEIMCNIAIAYIQIGEYQDAEKYINQSLEINPKDEITLAWQEKLKSLLINE